MLLKLILSQLYLLFYIFLLISCAFLIKKSGILRHENPAKVNFVLFWYLLMKILLSLHRYLLLFHMINAKSTGIIPANNFRYLLSPQRSRDVRSDSRWENAATP